MPCPSLPTELLTQIIAEAAIELPEGDTYQRNKDLRSFSLVSSQWRAIAQAELIRQPTVGTLESMAGLALRLEDDSATKVKHIRFVPHGDDEQPLEVMLAVILSALEVGSLHLSLLYRNVSQRFTLDAHTFAAASNHLTYLALADLEIRALLPQTPSHITFPHLTTLDLRRVHASGLHGAGYHLGQRATTPQLRTLHISASKQGCMTISDFLEMAEQISDLSLGVHLDHGHLGRFTALNTFEFEWPLQEPDPLASLNLPGGPLEVLRIVDRHQRFLTSGRTLGLAQRRFLEQSPEPEWPSSPTSSSGSSEAESTHSPPGVDDERIRNPFETSVDEEEVERLQREEEETRRAEEEDRRAERIDAIASKLADYLSTGFETLKFLYLPLPFASAVRQPNSDYDYASVDRLADVCEENGIEMRFGTRTWDSQLGNKRIAGVKRGRHSWIWCVPSCRRD